MAEHMPLIAAAIDATEEAIQAVPFLDRWHAQEKALRAALAYLFEALAAEPKGGLLG
jgi:hypothetical protein